MFELPFARGFQDDKPATAKDLIVAPEQLGSYHKDHFELSDNFYRQQLGVPTQLDRSLPGAAPSLGRQKVVNKALRDDGPGKNKERQLRSD